MYRRSGQAGARGRDARKPAAQLRKARAGWRIGCEESADAAENCARKLVLLGAACAAGALPAGLKYRPSPPASRAWTRDLSTTKPACCTRGFLTSPTLSSAASTRSAAIMLALMVAVCDRSIAPNSAADSCPRAACRPRGRRNSRGRQASAPLRRSRRDRRARRPTRRRRS